MNKFELILCALLALTSCLKHTHAEFTAADCRELGFIKTQLMCSNCDKLDDFGLETLKPHCKECCTQDQQTAAQRTYAKAILEVCTCKFRAYPQIQAFVQSGRPAKFPNLQIKYVRGLDPIVKLLDARGKVLETLSITKWNTDTVEEFFETHLSKEGAGGGGGKNSYSVVEDADGEEEDYLRTNRI
ncbi:selenoprotein F [Drosophila grimshawi]|uniref:Selenoprotein F n=1 Tax=Drosophila grimshawi TaxID=7222 RepID=B4J3J7_DROGR|nr:selenoprotein F [Drosophila grimshawi]EDV96199.1 GH16126 [Drosophila grimshawi]